MRISQTYGYKVMMMPLFQVMLEIIYYAPFFVMKYIKREIIIFIKK